jgi:hypothetical protein
MNNRNYAAGSKVLPFDPALCHFDPAQYGITQDHDPALCRIARGYIQILYKTKSRAMRRNAGSTLIRLYFREFVTKFENIL